MKKYDNLNFTLILMLSYFLLKGFSLTVINIFKILGLQLRRWDIQHMI